MDKTRMNFIKTKDKETADKLRKIGFPELGQSNGFYTFANCTALTFEGENLEINKLQYTNIYTAS